MVTHQPELTFVMADEEQLAELAAGRVPVTGERWRPAHAEVRISPRMTGVVLLELSEGRQPRPLLLVTREDDQRRLFARFAQLRSDLSPLTAWCHVVSPATASRLDAAIRGATLGPMTAAWAGLVVAEATLAYRRSPQKLTISACLSTQSFVFARALALWGETHLTEVLERYDAARSAFGVKTSVAQTSRSAFGSIWTALLGATIGVPVSDKATWRLSEALRKLNEARLHDEPAEGRVIATSLLGAFPEAPDFKDIEKRSADDRLALYDKIIDRLSSRDRKADASEFGASTFACGYLATILAGGSASIGVAEASATTFPEILAWAYTIGGIGEKVTWTSSFEGLGRLVVRELERSFYMVDPPTCDFAVEEVQALVDPALSDPFVHLRVKSSRWVSVALFPGVNLSVPGPRERESASPSHANRAAQQGARSSTATSDVLAQLADALIPYLKNRLAPPEPKASSADRSRGRSAQRREPYRRVEGELPWPDDD